MREFLISEKNGLPLKEFINDLKHTYDNCIIHLADENLNFKMELGELKTPIHEILLNKKISQIIYKVDDKDDIYSVWLESDKDSNVNSNAVNKFFLENYDKLCNKIKNTLPKDYIIMGISSYIRFDEIGPYLEIQIKEYYEEDKNKTSSKYYLN